MKPLHPRMSLFNVLHDDFDGNEGVRMEDHLPLIEYESLGPSPDTRGGCLGRMKEKFGIDELEEEAYEPEDWLGPCSE